MQGEKKDRFNAIQQELSQLSSKFSNNVLDSTKAYKKLVTDPEVLDGLPESALSLYAQQAKNDGHEDVTTEKGPWLLTLVGLPFLRCTTLHSEVGKQLSTLTAKSHTLIPCLESRFVAIPQEDQLREWSISKFNACLVCLEYHASTLSCSVWIFSVTGNTLHP